MTDLSLSGNCLVMEAFYFPHRLIQSAVNSTGNYSDYPHQRNLSRYFIYLVYG